MKEGRFLLPLEYPAALRGMRRPLHVAGSLRPGRCHVAIVGAREASADSLTLARRLAAIVVAADGVVVSGGADGVDAAAHSGAIAAGGRTWSVLGCGPPNITPDRPARFEEILASGGAVVRPFAEDTHASGSCYRGRNQILVALSEIVVIIQAAADSGTRNSATHARKLGREIWVAPGVGDGFVHSWELIDSGARVLRHESELVRRLAAPTLTDEPLAVYETLARGPKHPDEIAAETGLSTSAVANALLTLALGDVVVEGSAGLFQRK